MKCQAIGCQNKATTIVALKSTGYRKRVRCDACVAEIKRTHDNPERPNTFTGKLEYISLAAQEAQPKPQGEE